ncbi:hypothetical protein V1478_016929 [Vespula squamosa]|uniref:Uncharacterized protein n=1 Tax=Vespula squamosa TaxID=30214 RepID=A0ABD1ZXZ1_VESSQ
MQKSIHYRPIKCKIKQSIMSISIDCALMLNLLFAISSSKLYLFTTIQRRPVVKKGQNRSKITIIDE